jgi:hypothetical protein
MQEKINKIVEEQHKQRVAKLQQEIKDAENFILLNPHIFNIVEQKN